MLVLLSFLTIFSGYSLPAQVEARNKSHGETVVRHELCLFIASAGVCRKKKPYKVYAFDYEKNRCHPFLYSGCGGNPNRFATKAKCLNMCFVTKTTPSPVDSTEDYSYEIPLDYDLKPIENNPTIGPIDFIDDDDEFQALFPPELRGAKKKKSGKKKSKMSS